MVYSGSGIDDEMLYKKLLYTVQQQQDNDSLYKNDLRIDTRCNTAAEDIHYRSDVELFYLFETEPALWVTWLVKFVVSSVPNGQLRGVLVKLVSVPDRVPVMDGFAMCHVAIQGED